MAAKTKVIRIVVTAKDLELGEQKDCFKCPVARALSRAANKAFPTVTQVCVVPDAARLGTIRVTKWKSELPAKVQTFITTFDTFGRKGIRPFSATLKFERTT